MILCVVRLQILREVYLLCIEFRALDSIIWSSIASSVYHGGQGECKIYNLRARPIAKWYAVTEVILRSQGTGICDILVLICELNTVV